MQSILHAARSASVVSLAFTLLSAEPSSAQNAANFTEPGSHRFETPHALPAECAHYRDVSLTVEGREFRVSTITSRESAGGAPAYCLLEVHAAPALRVDLALPAQWNGRLYMNGNGGYAGEAVDSLMRDAPRAAALAQGFAVVGTNTGHDGAAEPLASFATDQDKLLDYAHRAVHQSALVAKALLKQIYGADPRYSYFDGCSTGGREGLMAAQRYPTDFNGVISGAPVFDFIGSQLWGVKTSQLLAGADIGEPEMRVVAAALMKACDANDGLSDGLISDPLHCRFNVRRDVPLCNTGVTPKGSCLTAKQQSALAAVYAPARIGGGRTFPGQPVGAEAVGSGYPGFPSTDGWAGWYYPTTTGLFAGAKDGVRAVFGETFLREVLRVDATWQTFDFSDRSLRNGPSVSALLDATDTDLRPFNAAGGKLLLYFGLADGALNPTRLVQYYDAVRRRMGPSTADTFSRLYLAPGMFHCSGGYGPDRFDLMSRMIDWVEDGKAPGALVATQMNPANPNQALRSRPLCAYPAVSHYRGNGDINSANSFSCGAPRGDSHK